MAFKPLLQEIRLKNWLSESFSEALTSKLWNKQKYMLPKLTEMERNWITFTPYGFIKNLRLIHQRESHMRFTGKMKAAIPCEQNYVAWLVKNDKTVFSKLTREISLSVSGKQAIRWASTWPLSVPFSDF